MARVEVNLHAEVDASNNVSQLFVSCAGKTAQAVGIGSALTLTDGATVNWDMNAGTIAAVTLAGNRTFAAPTNMAVGTYILHVVQDGTGSRTITWNAIFKWPGGIAPILTTTAAARDVFSFVSDGTNLYGSYLSDVK